MAKDKTAYVCENCGQESVKWLGKCPACNQWGTMKEIKIGPSPSSSRGKSLSLTTQQRPTPQQLHNIETSSEPRIDMGDGELNRVLGGGLYPEALFFLAANQASARAHSPCRPFFNCKTVAFSILAEKKVQDRLS